MKGIALVLLVLIAGLTAAGWQASAVSHPGASPAPLTMQLFNGPKAARTLLADRIETKNSVTYTTDPGINRAMKKEHKEEKQKEKNSWKMLQHMFLPARGYHRHPSAQSGSAPSQ